MFYMRLDHFSQNVIPLSVLIIGNTYDGLLHETCEVTRWKHVHIYILTHL